MVTKKSVEEVLKSIPDPEIGVSLMDLGLIYNIEVDGGKIEILMTLTTIGCPLFEQIAGPIRREIHKIPGVTEVNVLLTFEPPWKPEMLSDSAKAQLGFT